MKKLGACKRCVREQLLLCVNRVRQPCSMLPALHALTSALTVCRHERWFMPQKQLSLEADLAGLNAWYLLLQHVLETVRAFQAKLSAVHESWLW